YRPGSREGKQLLAHELTHVTQQRSDRPPYGFGGVGIQRQTKPKKGPPPIPKEHPEVASAAEKLADEGITMNSYKLFQEGGRNWFFSPNGKLEGARQRPDSLESWSAFNTLWSKPKTKQHAQVIVHLAELDDKNLKANQWPKLKAAYETWPIDRYAVFQAADDRKSYTCNIFAGDSLYLAKKSQMRGEKYYSAAEIYRAEGNFQEVPGDKLQRGDIASMLSGHHVEVVTSVSRGALFAADSFCSRGGGRPDVGVEKCDTWFDSNREIESSADKFRRVNHAKK
ncbi:MAG TPA: DUF4157 domain-containing protein, partial [Thermoanaerobaculia bacterium]|nr:DUF4157 domain-containing protein [Thermoanaerobaculia bacterium]